MPQGSLGFAKLTGVRDLVWAAHRMGTSAEDLRLREQDMSDMFWDIHSYEAKKAVLRLWAVGECKKRRLGTRGRPRASTGLVNPVTSSSGSCRRKRSPVL